MIRMIHRTLVRSLAAAALASVAPAWAESSPSRIEAPAEDVVEKVAVRNRLYSVGGKWELSPFVGLMVQTNLTDHYNFGVAGAYNVNDTIAFEGRLAYALSRHTGLANQVAAQLLQRNPASELRQVDDFANLWEMNANALVGLRWQPIYGKISLMAELPVHFQGYLWVGGGAGMFHRESIVYCQKVESRAEGTCSNWLQEDKINWLGSAAIGMRFFTHQKGAIKLELRNYLFPDSYRVDIDRTQAEQGKSTGAEASAGVTPLWMFDLGYTFFF
jgi:outer membrane beta-barrel protein